MDECIHGMNPTWCGICSAVDPVGASGRSAPQGGETKQDVLDDICDLVGIPRQAVSTGSSLPSEVFVAAARATGVPVGSMPEICEAIVCRAGLSYSSDFDSRATPSGGGSTVTLVGLQALRTALSRLLPPS